MVCIVDDDASLRRSLTRLFRSVHLATESFASGKEFLDRQPHNGPSCVVLDVQMPGISGIELQEKLEKNSPQIVFLTGHGEVPMCIQAMKAGAVDFLTKPVDEEDLLAAVDRALTRSAEERRIACERAEARALLNALTPREFEVMQCVIAGFQNKEIAETLNASEKTIKIHRGRVMKKMEVTSVARLVHTARVAGVKLSGA